MVNKSLKTDNGRKIALYRAYTDNADLSSTLYRAPTKFRVGVGNADITLAATALDDPIPIDDGTVLESGEDAFTGSNGADNSTDNTSVYKPGAGASDDTAQNLIANDTNATKTWTITPDSNADSTLRTGLWIYIKDAAALAKFASSGTALEVKLGSDASNYYSQTYEASDLATGWNWLSTGDDTLGDWTETGTVSGNIDTFIIEITTNNATDEFVAGDVVFDLLRQWTRAQSVKEYMSGYPSFDYSLLEVRRQLFLAADEANGFPINAISTENEDSTPLVSDMHVFTDDSKSINDEFKFVVVDRFR